MCWKLASKGEVGKCKFSCLILSNLSAIIFNIFSIFCFWGEIEARCCNVGQKCPPNEFFYFHLNQLRQKMKAINNQSRLKRGKSEQTARNQFDVPWTTHVWDTHEFSPRSLNLCLFSFGSPPLANEPTKCVSNFSWLIGIRIKVKQKIAISRWLQIFRIS